jgi:hypothetical protein
MKEKSFGQTIKDMIDEAGPMANKREYLEDIFKFYVADFWIYAKEVCEKNKEELTVDTVTQSKRQLIDSFYNIEGMAEIQLSLEKYEELFEKTVQEILNEAALAHEGQDSMTYNSNLEINADAYADANNFSKTSSGIYVPNS